MPFTARPPYRCLVQEPDAARLAHWFALWAVHAQHDVAALDTTALSVAVGGGGGRQGKGSKRGGSGGGGGASSVAPLQAIELALLEDEEARKVASAGEPAITAMRGMAVLVSAGTWVGWRPCRRQDWLLAEASGAELEARWLKTRCVGQHCICLTAPKSTGWLWLQAQLAEEVCCVLHGVQAPLPPVVEEWQKAAAATKVGVVVDWVRAGGRLALC